MLWVLTCMFAVLGTLSAQSNQGSIAGNVLDGSGGAVTNAPLMTRRAGEPFRTLNPKYGTVYRVNSSEEPWKHGYVYQTHRRTKGSTGFPDKILDTAYFRDPHYVGVGWKAMPSDLSLPGLAVRAFKVADDLNNLGLHKVMLGKAICFN